MIRLRGYTLNSSVVWFPEKGSSFLEILSSQGYILFWLRPTSLGWWMHYTGERAAIYRMPSE
jgi:hypothetical protein